MDSTEVSSKSRKIVQRDLALLLFVLLSPQKEEPGETLTNDIFIMSLN